MENVKVNELIVYTQALNAKTVHLPLYMPMARFSEGNLLHSTQ